MKDLRGIPRPHSLGALGGSPGGAGRGDEEGGSSTGFQLRFEGWAERVWTCAAGEVRPSALEPSEAAAGSAHLSKGIYSISYHDPSHSSLRSMRLRAAEGFGAIAREALCSSGGPRVGRALRMLRFASHHIQSAFATENSSAEVESPGTDEIMLLRRLLCLTGDAHAAVPSVCVTERLLYAEQQQLLGLTPDSEVAVDGEDGASVHALLGLGADCDGSGISGTHARGYVDASLAQELTLDPERNLNYATQYYFKAIKLFRVGSPDCAPEAADAERTAAVQALEAAYGALGRLFLSTGRFTKAHQHFHQGIALFRSFGGGSTEATCVASAFCQVARLFTGRNARLDPTSVDTLAERENNASQAISNYKAALEALRSRSHAHKLWDAARAELGEAYFVAASSLHRTFPLAAEPTEVARAVGDMYRGALDVYTELAENAGEDEVESAGGGASLSKRALWVAEAANVHRSLGVLFGQCLRLQQQPNGDIAAPAPAANGGGSGTGGKPKILTLAQSHLEEAVAIYDDKALLVQAVGARLDLAALHAELASAGVRGASFERGLDLIVHGVRAVYERAAEHTGTAAEMASTERESAGGGGGGGGGDADGAAAADATKEGVTAATWSKVEARLHDLLKEALRSGGVAGDGGSGGESNPNASAASLREVYRICLTERDHSKPVNLLRKLSESLHPK